ncbi:MAG: NUDIX domain-containing protein [Thiogranum sp.]
MSVQSAGILLFRFKRKKLEILLAHPGGPFFEHRDEGVWSIPKGLCEDNESLLDTARREFQEETGFAVDGNFTGLGKLRLKSGKIVHAWALEYDIDATSMVSNTFEMEWPRHSGQVREFPEMDRAAWFDLVEARLKITKGQAGFIDRLVASIDYFSSDG